MKVLLAVLVAAVPIVYWLVRRRVRPHEAKEREPDTNHSGTSLPLTETTESLSVGEATADTAMAEARVQEKAEADNVLPPDLPNAMEEAAAATAPVVAESAERYAVEDSLGGNEAEGQSELNAAAPEHSQETCAPALVNGTAESLESEIPSALSTGAEAIARRASLEALNIPSELVSGFEDKPAAAVQVFPADVQPSEAVLLETRNGEEAVPAADAVEPALDQEEKAALLYRAPRQRPPRLPQRRPANQQEKPRSVSAETPLEIQVGVIFDRFGFCSVGLLPKRTEGLDDEVDAKDGRSVVRLSALDEWYQELQFDDIGDRLRNGFELKGELADRRQVRWRLSGRTIYVLAAHQGTNKLVSTQRLHLDRPDVVLCTAEILPQVEAVLASSGCEGYTKFDESYGAPRGWIGLRGVVPRRALLLEDSDPFYPLKPETDIQIELDGGIYLLNSVWLAGYPPQIRIAGTSDVPVKVLIDGKPAQQTDEGVFAAEGHDAPGQHSVYCEGLARSCSYSIEEAPESWEEWPAYGFGQAGICGPLVELRDDAAKQRLFAVQVSNPLLLGAEPGQVFRCSPRKSASWKGYVPFDVVWALPAQPLICNKKTARILQFRETLPSALNIRANSGAAWCNAILDASRKGLRIANPSENSTACWREYRKAARNIRKGRR
jgi:hypothetical protein